MLQYPAEGEGAPVQLIGSSDPIESVITLPPAVDGDMLQTLQFEVSHPAIDGLTIDGLKNGDAFVVTFQQDGRTVVRRRHGTVAARSQPTGQVLADLAFQFSVNPPTVDQLGELLPGTCILSMTPSVYLQLIRKSDMATLGERFLHGDMEMLADSKRYDWTEESIARRLSPDQDGGEIRRAVRREFNSHRDGGIQLDDTDETFWSQVREGADSYYDAARTDRRGTREQFKDGLEKQIEVLTSYETTLATLDDLTRQLHAEDLHVRAYTVVDGYVIDIMQTRQSNERD